MEIGPLRGAAFLRPYGFYWRKTPGRACSHSDPSHPHVMSFGAAPSSWPGPLIPCGDFGRPLHLTLASSLQWAGATPARPGGGGCSLNIYINIRRINICLWTHQVGEAWASEKAQSALPLKAPPDRREDGKVSQEPIFFPFGNYQSVLVSISLFLFCFRFHIWVK